MNSMKERNRRTVSNYSKPIELIDLAIKDESNLISLYEHLKEIAVNENEKEILNQNQMDCQKHMKIFMSIYRKVNRMDYTDNTVTKPFGEATLKSLYGRCIFESLDCVEFYRKIYFIYPDADIKDMLFEVITDKQAHAIKMLYLSLS